MVMRNSSSSTTGGAGSATTGTGAGGSGSTGISSSRAPVAGAAISSAGTFGATIGAAAGAVVAARIADGPSSTLFNSSPQSGGAFPVPTVWEGSGGGNLTSSEGVTSVGSATHFGAAVAGIGGGTGSGAGASAAGGSGAGSY